MNNNSIRMVMILGLIGDNSIRMSQIPKLGDGINCVFLIDKGDKLAPMSLQNNNKTTGYFSTVIPSECHRFQNWRIVFTAKWAYVTEVGG